MPSKTSWIETAVNEPKILGKFIPHHLNISISSKVGVAEKREWFLPRILSRMWLKWHLIVELPVLVGTEERRPHLRHRVFCDHLEPCLERVVNLDLALVSVHLYPASTRSLTYVKSEYSLLQIMITNRQYVQKNVLYDFNVSFSIILTFLGRGRSRCQPLYPHEGLRSCPWRS